MITDRVYDVINFLLRRYSNHRPPEIDDRSPLEILQARGFSLDEIGQAYEFLFSGTDKITPTGEKHEQGLTLRKSVRVLTPAERHKLDLGAQGLLHMLSMSDSTSSQDIEALIQAAMSMDTQEVTAADLLSLMRQVLGEAHTMFNMSDELPSPSAHKNHNSVH